MSGLKAVLFDMDGVITDTASAHAQAWKALFDGYLEKHHAGEPEFDIETDYREHVDGKPRYDGVRDFLASRGITLAEGTPEDAPGTLTVCGLGNEKNVAFNRWIAENPVEPYPGTLALLDALDEAGIAVALFTSSRNADAVLGAAGLSDRFAVRIDGVVMAKRGLPGKPDPAIMHQAAEALGIAPADCAIVEDAVSGVQAGAKGGFAQVIGVAREDNADALDAAGADIVVRDLAELQLDGGRLALRTLHGLPDALAEMEAIARRLSGKRVAVFLDYDGTLSPIVDNPDDAILSDGMRAAIERLSQVASVAIVSGRDLDDVCGFVQLDHLYYAGSHGFDMAGPDGWRHVVEKGKAFLPALDDATQKLEEALSGIPGARVERKKFSLAVHYRHVAREAEAKVEEIVREVVADNGKLRASGGKKVYDVKPRADWHKGRAVLALLDTLGLAGDDVVAFYLGDDTTDEDAFRILARDGIGIVVRDRENRASAARYALDDVEAVERLLAGLARRLEG
ncbi:MAG: trehalose-phosphatase [Salinarimonas sp.]|nr:trehalose-phosphatase [Salinarimonas sp.]